MAILNMCRHPVADLIYHPVSGVYLADLMHGKCRARPRECLPMTSLLEAAVKYDIELQKRKDWQGGKTSWSV